MINSQLNISSSFLAQTFCVYIKKKVYNFINMLINLLKIISDVYVNNNNKKSCSLKSMYKLL